MNYVANWRRLSVNKKSLDRLKFLVDLIVNPREGYADEVQANSANYDKDRKLIPSVMTRYAIDLLLELQGWNSAQSNGNGYTFWTRPNILSSPNEDALVTMISYPSSPANDPQHRLNHLQFIASYTTKETNYDCQPTTTEISIVDIVNITCQKIKEIEEELNIRFGDSVVASLV